MTEQQTIINELSAALEQSITEAKQLEAIFERLHKVLTDNGFQISIDIGGIVRNLEHRLEGAHENVQSAFTRYERLEELVRTFALITSSLELDMVLEEVMDTVIRLTGAERAYLMLSDKDTDELDIAVARNWDRENIADNEAVFSRSIVARALAEQQAILTTNAAADDRFQNIKSVMNNQLRSILCVPLVLHGRTIGVLYADNRITQDVFKQEEIPLLTAFGSQAAIAIENARRYGEVKSDLALALTQIQSLQIEIDRHRVDEQVNQITESDYFQRLSAEARSMRQRSGRD